MEKELNKECSIQSHSQNFLRLQAILWYWQQQYVGYINSKVKKKTREGYSREERLSRQKVQRKK